MNQIMVNAVEFDALLKEVKYLKAENEKLKEQLKDSQGRIQALTPEVTPEVPCKTHPDAPHGFDRNASHSADRYVCECEGWEPVDNVDMSEERVPKTDKSIHEPEGWVKIDEVRKYFDSVGCGTIYKTAGEGRVPLYTAPYTKLDTTAGVLRKEWVGLTDEDFYKKDDETVFVLGMKFAEARLKEKNT